MTEYADRIAELHERAQADVADFEPPADPPDEERAMEYLREGAGQAVWLYVEARTGGRMAPFPPEELDRLRAAMNRWLELYARCYGAEVEASYPVRTAAEALLDTHNIRDVARVLTKVPERDGAE